MKKVLITVLFFCAAYCPWASELGLKIVMHPEHAIVAEPVQVFLTLESSSAFTLPKSFGRCDGHSQIIIIDAAGKRWGTSPAVPPCPPGMPPPCDSPIKYPEYACVASAQFQLSLPPGRYTVHAEYQSAGPYFDRGCGPARKEVPGVWSGTLISNSTTLLVEPASGMDAEVLRSFGGPAGSLQDPRQQAAMLVEHSGDILARFPTSTYAAYVVRHISGAEGIAQSEPAKMIADRAGSWSPNLLETIQVPFDEINGKKVGGEIRGETAIAWRRKWFGIVLKNHPDIWFADELRLRSAMDQLTLKNYQAVQAELEAIAKDENAPMAARAKEYLGLMKQKGWIKN